MGRPLSSAPAPGLTRRDLLRMGPGAAAALAFGCGPRQPSAADRALDAGRITGSIVGASHRVGHRLRDGRFPEPQQVREVPVVIVGAGIAGLSAGWKLAGSGFRDFVVLELGAGARRQRAVGRERGLRLPVGCPLSAHAERRIDRRPRAGRRDGPGPGSRPGRRADLRPAASLPRPAGAGVHRRLLARGIVGAGRRRCGRRGRCGQCGQCRRRGGARRVRGAGAALPGVPGCPGPPGLRAAARRGLDRSGDSGPGPHLDARVL